MIIHIMKYGGTLYVHTITQNKLATHQKSALQLVTGPLA